MFHLESLSICLNGLCGIIGSQPHQVVETEPQIMETIQRRVKKMLLSVVVSSLEQRLSEQRNSGMFFRQESPLL